MLLIFFIFCALFQKISILPPQKGLEFPGGWGFWKAKKFKEMYEAQSEFPEGWGNLEKFPAPLIFVYIVLQC